VRRGKPAGKRVKTEPDVKAAPRTSCAILAMKVPIHLLTSRVPQRAGRGGRRRKCDQWSRPGI
jgi:hypothetical protein